MQSNMRYVRNGGGTVRPYVYGGLNLLDFAKNVFGAIEVENNKMPNGSHVEARIGDSMLVLVAMDPPYAQGTKASIYVYVEDVDAAYKRALAEGATSLSEPADRPWKGRQCGVRDSYGNVWYIETYTG
jgi:PhnB protein